MRNHLLGKDLRQEPSLSEAQFIDLYDEGFGLA